ncbi:Phosphatidylinositol 4-kinase gamma 6 [Dichanthelium oligosanthes]|uniref:1-phosphatidylinositol 4-kinase n=1 Tax=Dichanthelium oligosanthes TaxID=888268 RepID=A0A1E5WA76_9POAL|nr:Phosphatidylinositol 4-kinase gamma 6 [Dichanthelium oligosanthes]
MSPNLDSAIKSQVPALLLRRLFGASRRDEAKQLSRSPAPGAPVGRRRVFVQTETGCVLGMDLDRGDNAHTIKRRLQLALNVPTGETSLSFGDRILENDLSFIRPDSPLLLTRNSINRSCSTPCLCPVSKDFEQKDCSGLVEMLGCSSSCDRVKRLVDDVVIAIRSGVDPVPISSGLGGSYYFRNVSGDRVAIVKPTDEEPFAPNNPKGFVGRALGQPGLKKSVRVGETGFREVAAYLLDHENFANVPATALVKITHSIFNINCPVNGGNPAPAHDQKQQVNSKIASFQQFIAHDFDASDHGTSSFPVAAVHRIGILDIRIFNTDRHAGNVLVRKLNGGTGRFGCQTELFPIDHGMCLPENLEDPYFEWIHWAQASIPFSEEELEYIRNLDPGKDVMMLRRELPMIREACLRVLVLCTIFLKEAAAFGLCLAEIGEMMTREFRGMEEEPSQLEVLCMEARKRVAEWEPFSATSEQEDDIDFQFSMDMLGEYNDVMRSPRLNGSGFKGSSFRSPLSKLVESIDEGNDGHEDQNEPDRVFYTGWNTSNVPSKAMGQNGNATKSAMNRSADEQLPSSMCFVRLSDMSTDEWNVFLEKLQELLKEALHERARAAAGQRMKQRLGTSCKF